MYKKQPVNNPIFAAIAGTLFVKYPTTIIVKIYVKFIKIN